MDIQGWTQSNLALPAIIFALLILSWIWILLLSKRISRMQKKQKRMLKETGYANLEGALQQYNDDLKGLQEKVQQLMEDFKIQRSSYEKCIGPIGIVRFNAFDDMGGDLSFAIAILNQHKNGVVISSIIGREDQRTYAKPIENGTSVYLLSDEEKEALQQAIQKME